MVKLWGWFSVSEESAQAESCHNWTAGANQPWSAQDALYGQPIPSTRGGSLFNAHAYPTKINAEAVVPFIAAHTNPGDLVFDGFGGSGATGLAASLCGDPGPETRAATEGRLGKVEWGARRCELYDISKLATLVSSTLIHPPDPSRFVRAAREVLASMTAELGWLYEALDETSTTGAIRHIVWSDHPVCPRCSSSSSFWDLCVVLTPPSLRSKVNCPHCGMAFDVASAERVKEDYFDDLLGETRTRRVRRPVFVYGRTGKNLWKRPVIESDLLLVKRLEGVSIPSWVPVTPMLSSNLEKWGELHRAGYHYGMTHLHHFYTRRNLIAVASAWQKASSFPDDLRDALRFWVSSYNSSHSTVMTRVVCKKNAKDLVLTSAEPGALYVSSLPVEKNVIEGLRSKMKPIMDAFVRMHGKGDGVSVRNRSSLDVQLGDSSVDYIFTDPPFGDNIQYSEVNFISEAWLGSTTDQKDEVIVSRSQGKSVDDYETLLARGFSENYRILKPGHHMTVVFHSTKPVIWAALRNAWETAGFKMVGSTVLDKTQSSFKQTRTRGAVQGDPVILLRKPLPEEVCAEEECALRNDAEEESPWDIIRKRLTSLDENAYSGAERSRQRLFSYLVRHCLETKRHLPLDASQFFAGLDKLFVCREGAYYAAT